MLEVSPLPCTCTVGSCVVQIIRAISYSVVSESNQFCLLACACTGGGGDAAGDAPAAAEAKKESSEEGSDESMGGLFD